jgi:hypothetical protein
MTKPTIRIYNGSGINDYIDREMTSAEFAQYEIDVAKEQARQAEAEAKAQAKATAQAKLAALGITVEDLTALGL